LGISSAADLGPQAAPEREDRAAVDAARGILNQRLMDSLVHDVRNPLNALSINLDVLVEKLRREQGEIPDTQQKNLRVMREQIFRVDGLLKHFGEHMGLPRGTEGPTCDLSEALGQVVELLGHETRRAMIKVRQMVEPGLTVRGKRDDVRFLAMQALFRGIGRAGEEGELDLSLQRDGQRAALRIRDGNPDPAFEPFVHAVGALHSVAHTVSGEVRVAGNEALIILPLE
jgi:signal transduction histidine kinase